MSDLYKHLQAITLLSQELHINFDEAERILEKENKFNLNYTQQEAAAMVDEMLD